MIFCPIKIPKSSITAYNTPYVVEGYMICLYLHINIFYLQVKQGEQMGNFVQLKRKRDKISNTFSLQPYKKMRLDNFFPAAEQQDPGLLPDTFSSRKIQITGALRRIRQIFNNERSMQKKFNVTYCPLCKYKLFKEIEKTNYNVKDIKLILQQESKPLVRWCNNGSSKTKKLLLFTGFCDSAYGSDDSEEDPEFEEVERDPNLKSILKKWNSGGGDKKSVKFAEGRPQVRLIPGRECRCTRGSMDDIDFVDVMEDEWHLVEDIVLGPHDENSASLTQSKRARKQKKVLEPEYANEDNLNPTNSASLTKALTSSNKAKKRDDNTATSQEESLPTKKLKQLPLLQ